jgi:hypothetical protein
VVELAIRPVELGADTLRWNTEKNKIASITCGGVRFERKSQAFVQKELTTEKKSRELARIERRDKLILLGILAAIVAYEVYFRWWHTG